MNLVLHSHDALLRIVKTTTDPREAITLLYQAMHTALELRTRHDHDVAVVALENADAKVREIDAKIKLHTESSRHEKERANIQVTALRRLVDLLIGTSRPDSADDVPNEPETP